MNGIIIEKWIIIESDDALIDEVDSFNTIYFEVCKYDYLS